MLTIEQYAAVYLPMITANGDQQQEQTICQPYGFTPEQWQEAKAYYTTQMMAPGDGGKTAMAFSAAMMKGTTMPSPTVALIRPQALLPADFTASRMQIWISEHDIQMVQWALPETGRFLLIQLAYTFDEQQRKFGMDTYHISINDQEFSIYGGVEKVLLERGKVTFFFNQEGAARMQCGQLTITFSIDGKMYNYLCRKMSFIFAGLLDIVSLPKPESFEVNGLILMDEWQYFETPVNEVNVRTRLHNLKDSKRFPLVVFIDFQSTTIGTDETELHLIDEVEASLRDTLEHDLNAVIAFDTTNEQGRRFYIYSALDEQAFMQRINEALRLFPQLPLAFNGGEDPEWNNYLQCLADMQQYKDA